jgi:hypothetical protein
MQPAPLGARCRGVGVRVSCPTAGAAAAASAPALDGSHRTTATTRQRYSIIGAELSLVTGSRSDGGCARKRSRHYDSSAQAPLDFGKEKRARTMLIDQKRNYRGAIAVAAYSTRARPPGTVGVPRSWRELAATRQRRLASERCAPAHAAIAWPTPRVRGRPLARSRSRREVPQRYGER